MATANVEKRIEVISSVHWCPIFAEIRSTVLDVVDATICPTEEADLRVDKDLKMALVLANNNPVMVTE